MQFLMTFMLFGIIGTLIALDYERPISWFINVLLAVVASAFNAVNWHRYLSIQYGGPSSRSVSDYSSSANGCSGGDYDAGGSSFGGGSSDGGGASGSW